MNTEQIVGLLDVEIARLRQAKELLSSIKRDVTVPGKKGRGRPRKIDSVVTANAPVKRRALSAEARARISAAQKKRHAANKRAAKKAAKDESSQSSASE